MVITQGHGSQNSGSPAKMRTPGPSLPRPTLAGVCSAASPTCRGDLVLPLPRSPYQADTGWVGRVAAVGVPVTTVTLMGGWVTAAPSGGSIGSTVQSGAGGWMGGGGTLPPISETSRQHSPWRREGEAHLREARCCETSVTCRKCKTKKRGRR